MDSMLAVSVSEFVALLNQTLAYAYPRVTITGEVVHFRVSKNRWVYFDLKDEQATVRFFGTVYQLPGPLEDGMVVAVTGTPRMHPQYNFSVTVQTIRFVGEGSIKKAAALLEARLRGEGLFDESRKRPLPYPPKHIGLIASGESAAYHDFIKILNARWGGVRISHCDVQVQGEQAVGQIMAAVQQLNELAEPPDVLVITRGGGSADDLQVFSTEQLTRAVAASRVPTLVAIGHEVDMSLAELAADVRASTPSNAAELLVPDRQAILHAVQLRRQRLDELAARAAQSARQTIVSRTKSLHDTAASVIHIARTRLNMRIATLKAYDPQAALRRGYAIVRSHDTVVRSGHAVHEGQDVAITLADATVQATVTNIIPHKESNHAKIAR